MLYFRVSESPHVMTVLGAPSPPREGDREVLGSRWKATKQVTPTLPENVLHSVNCAGEVEEALSQLYLILGTPPHPHSPHHLIVAS